MWKELLFLGMVMVCVSIVLSSEGEAAPNPIPIAAIEFGSDNHTVQSMPYCSTYVVVPGQVSIEKLQCIERVIVYLTADQIEGWDVVVEPSVIPFINPGHVRFVATVTVPPGVEPGERQLTVRLSARVPGLAPVKANATCSINVVGHRYATIGPVWPVCNISEDGQVRYDMIVWNLGSINDTYVFRIRHDDCEVLLLDGPATLTVPARQRVHVTFVFKVDDAKGEHDGDTLSFTMRSESGTGDWSAPMSYHVGHASTEVVVMDHDWQSSHWARGLEDWFLYLFVLEIWAVATFLLISAWSERSRSGGHRG